MSRLFLLCMAVAVGGAAALEPLTSAVLMHRMVQVGVSVFSKNVRLMPIEARVTKVLFKKAGNTEEAKIAWANNGAEFGTLTPAQFGAFVDVGAGRVVVIRA